MQIKNRNGFVVADDGAPIYYETSGQLYPATTVVFCDGIGCDGYIWKYLHRILKEDYRILHPHYRGHGKTKAPQDPTHVTMTHLADDVAAMMDACETERAVVFGHSMGVQVALETFRRHRERVAGLVLLCGSHSNPVKTFRGQNTLEQAMPWIRGVVDRIPKVSNLLWNKLIPSMLAYRLATKVEINGRLIHQEDFFPYLEGIARVDIRLFLNMLHAAEQHSAKDILEDIDVPVFILAGGRDSFTPMALSVDMHQRIKGSELYVVEEGSHTAPIERSLEVTSRVDEFLLKHFNTIAKEQPVVKQARSARPKRTPKEQQ